MKKESHHINQYFDDMINDIIYLKLKTSFIEKNLINSKQQAH